MSIRNQLVRASLLLVLALVLTAQLARATWSIVLVNRATGEVGVGCATCLTGMDLERYVPLIRPGIGAAAAQSYIDSGARNRRVIWAEFANGTPPSQILQILAQFDRNHQTRQYGIVDILGRAATFTGNQAGAFAGGLTGQIGEIFYAIQGNVITGRPVIERAELALINTPGDLAEKLMAGMEAAQSMGGDGRCSCNQGPTGCGSPPPSFTRAAYIGFVIVARVGDPEGLCNLLGCASGDYYLNLNVRNASASSPDPIPLLRQQMTQWRQQITGRPDHIRSSAAPVQPVLPADGFSRTRLLVHLRDWQGTALTDPSISVTVSHDASSAGLGQIYPAVHQGGNLWSIDIEAPEDAGTDRFRVVADDGSRPVLLYPFPEIRYDEVAPLQADKSAISAALGDPVFFTLFAKSRNAGRQYLLLLSLSGSSPGTPLGGGLTLPLNIDDATKVSAELVNTPFLFNTWSVYASDGRSVAALDPPPAVFNDIIGMDFTVAFFSLFPEDFASNPVVVHITP